MAKGELTHVVVTQGAIRRLVARSGFIREVELQRLILNEPELLAPIGDGLSFLPIGWEVQLPVGSLDLLFIGSDGILTLVETKLSANDESRRAVIGQLLDYAASITEWDVTRIVSCAEGFLTSPQAPDDITGLSFADAAARAFGWEQDGEDERAAKLDAFNARMDTAIQRGTLRVVCGVDQHIERLERLVEYLSRHSDLQVVLLQVNQFPVDGDLRVAIPTLHGDIGGTPQRSATTPNHRLTLDGLLSSFESESERAVVTALVSAARTEGASLELGPSGTSIRVLTPIHPQPITIAWIYAPGKMGWMRTKHLSFGHAFDTPAADLRLREVLSRYVVNIEECGVNGDARSKDVDARWTTAAEAAPRVEGIAAALRTVVRELRALIAEE